MAWFHNGRKYWYHNGKRYSKKIRFKKRLKYKKGFIIRNREGWLEYREFFHDKLPYNGQYDNLF